MCSNSLARIMANTTKYSHITVQKSFIGSLSCIALFSRRPYWCTSFYIVVIQTSLNLFLKPRQSVYRKCRSQSDGVLLEVPHFASTYKSKKHFGLSFAYDAPRVWNDLPDDVHSAKSLSSFKKKLKTYLYKSLPSLVFFCSCFRLFFFIPLQCF